MKTILSLILVTTFTVSASDYWVPPTATPIHILQPQSVDPVCRIPTSVPIYLFPVWSYPPQYQYPGYTLTPIYYGRQQVWPMPPNAQYIRWSSHPIIYPVGQWVPLYR